MLLIYINMLQKINSQLCVGYVSGKYNITDDLLTVITPEKKFEISENKLII
jgi:hypothetical protein